MATRSDPRSYIWRLIDEKTGVFGNIVEISMLVAPHKMTFNGTMYEEAAAGANERSDVFLTVNDMILMKVYHTTYVKPGTHSGQRTVRYLETRLLAQDTVDGELLQEVVWRFHKCWE